MYRVQMDIKQGQTTKSIDQTIKKEKLERLIGRFTLKYGPPFDITMEAGLNHLEFYRKDGQEVTQIDLCFIDLDHPKKTGSNNTTPPVTQTKKEEPVIEPPSLQMDSLIKGEVVTKVS